ncbi:hypothetical protein FisN_16Lu274 [Fistulifera solaris]|uniref:ABC transmembrane type-1 domain-containing protein n=1 Tax=Fistulifera solaris TaxID=1519565 RepID=A0A1Z5KNX7_FISSO|nr:hypothetical protein FisN_16Lu274 [Fistulifera solaris]|eukprot:GAX28023.1 hypothetical protein FisN_16Lu274 [Fistulifera solaris]
MTATDKLAETSRQVDSSKSRKSAAPQASVGETLGFLFECGFSTQLLFVVGFIAGIANGLVYPALAYLFSNSFSDISAASNDGLAQVRELAYTFLVVGAYALIASLIQGWCFEVCAYRGCMNLRLKWFKALLRQDAAYFDVNDTAGMANAVGPASTKYRRGLGRKFGEGIQFLCTGIFGIAYAFYSSWRVALVVLCVIPFVSASAMAVMTFNQGKGTRSAEAYSKAGSVAYTTVSSIRTVLSLNAIPSFIRQYEEATSEAMKMATSMLLKIGLANGSMLGSFLLLYATLSLYGTALFYRDIDDTGCDPSAGVAGAVSCESTGPDVFGSMLGVAFAAQGVSQFGNFSEAFTQARVAVYEALQTINRLPGAPEKKIFKPKDDALSTTTRSTKSNKSSEEVEQVLKAILPKYQIDSTATTGLKPESIAGSISVRDVHFNYPTRPGDPILNGMSVEIAAGQTVAFVGSSGGGKSTIVSLLERFYDPLSGVIELDGKDLKEYNVTHLRRMIGYVGQEPTLFATTIRGNIRYGNPDATDEQVEEAARMANAHDFISAFTDGYDTQVGDKGSQLSGEEKDYDNHHCSPLVNDS